MIRLEMKNYNLMLTKKSNDISTIIWKNWQIEYLTGGETLTSKQRQIIEQTKFTYSPLRKVFEKQIKMIEEQERKQIDVITNQNERLALLTNKDGHKDILWRIIWRTR